MDTRAFFRFIDSVYAFNGHYRTVEAMYNGKLKLGEWKKRIGDKRRGFEACVFTCCAENKEFKEQLYIYIDRFKTSLDNYEKSGWFENQFDINTEKRKFLEQKYHETRRKEIALAYKYLVSILNKEVDSDIKEESHYQDIYSIDQLEIIRKYLINNKYLHKDTSTEDFVYYFSGKGDKPQKPLQWIGYKIDAAFFIDTFYNKETKKWKKAQQVFGYERLDNSLSCKSYLINKVNPFKEFKDSL